MSTTTADPSAAGSDATTSGLETCGPEGGDPCEVASARYLAAIVACGYEIDGSTDCETGAIVECTEELAAASQCLADCAEQADCGVDLSEFFANIYDCKDSC